MNKGIKRMWITALLSGEYRQGKAALRAKGGQYCCLGVLADLIAPDGWSKEPCTISGHYEHVYMDEEEELLSEEALEKAGFEFSFQRRLATMNDNGKTFAEIADIIEAEA